MTTTTREELDQIINDHFMYEATNNLDGVMGSLAKKVLHEVVPSPVGEQTALDGIRAYYADLQKNVEGESVTPIRRYYGDNFVIDETMWHGTISDGSPFLLPGKSGKVSFRLLHVFEVTDGKISREQAWIDLAAIQDQLGCKIS